MLSSTFLSLSFSLLLSSTLLPRVVGAAAAASSRLATCASTRPAKPDYDFVVVGAGAGGGPVAARLAENGFSVLLVDVGHAVETVNTTIPFYFARAVADPAIELNYTYNEYSAGAKFPRDDAWYPRAGTVGGSTIHNAAINHIGATKRDFTALQTMFSDDTWSYDNMRTYFNKIEHNLDLDPSNPDHGFDGWLKTSVNPNSIFGNPAFADAQLSDISNTLASFPPGLVADTNSVAAEAAAGAGVPNFTIDEERLRTSVYNRIIAMMGSKLHLATNTLATKVMLCSGTQGKPTAYGVELAAGASLAVQHSFTGKKTLKTKVVTAKYEVIVSAGVFQTPQLLMLSGIGDRTQLSQNGITPVVHLPGVGQNLQDHDEVAVTWELKKNHTLFKDCTVLYTPATDPCLGTYFQDDHMNIYGLGGALFVLQTHSGVANALPDPDIMLYWLPGSFQGFFRGFQEPFARVHNALTAVTLLQHPTSKGSVTLTGSHPQDPLDINKHHFEVAGAKGGKRDIAALKAGVKTARSIVSGAGIKEHIKGETFGPAGTSDAALNDHVLEFVFGHHACCTAAMGPDSDPNAVLDGNFRVRGVDGLRVVDISSWPNVPGWFVTTPTYMISEKAADILTAQYAP